jgi:hypothetical protein
MSTAAISSSSLFEQLQSYFQSRQSDLQQLGQDLQNGDLTDAQQEYSALQTLGQSGPFANGDVFQSSGREQDFNAIGEALQSGNVSDAQQAFAQLEGNFQSGGATASGANSGSSASQSGGPEIVINLGNLTPGEQITIGVNNESNGSEQLTISVANQNQNESPEQATINLNANSNEQIVLNLINGNLLNTSSTASQGSGLNVSA